ncbi:hypothetical protein QWY85_08725 [Neolewinella lacunae]|uniref:Uncharacterized protein n=1 Tax=Neolewinella lacunae TaxID=1517758 RepID=A0A923PFW3_9BACT|nr:hypothetical protein [Neolewinella lacunae]MBC6993330.1 hypothetical protein [Neolewinella lacunae]MDN3634739.1 hypothetical protein [Neolewinella lacunae]
MASKNKIKLTANILLMFLASYGCSSHLALHDQYLSDDKGVKTSLQIDTSSRSFEFVVLGGLANDTVTGTYELNHKTVILKPYQSSIEILPLQDDLGFSLAVMDGRTGEVFSNYVVEKLVSGEIVLTTGSNVEANDTILVSYPGYDTTDKMVVTSAAFQIRLFRSFRKGDFLLLKVRNNKLISDKLVLHAQ